MADNSQTTIFTLMTVDWEVANRDEAFSEGPPSGGRSSRAVPWQARVIVQFHRYRQCPGSACSQVSIFV